MKKILLFILSILAVQKYSSAQTDTAFWLAAPDIAEVNHPLYGYYDRPISLRITSFSAAASVTISLPANSSFTPITLNIPPGSTSTVDLTPWINLIENFEPDNINNKGIYIRSTNIVTAYYEVNSVTCNCNPEIFALKGKNALGNEFYIPTQTTWAVDTVRHPTAKAGFTLVATEDNTTLTITPSKPLINRPANVPFTISMNKGQSYACIALYRNAPNLLNGSKVISNKPISVTDYEDLLFGDGPCADLAGDQLIPTSVFGMEFVVVRGDLSVRDKVVITASQNTTNIFLNGTSSPIATINAGQSYEYDLTPLNPTVYLRMDKLSGVYHYTGTGCELGAGVIPKLACTGSSSVSLVRSSNGGNASVMLVTKNGNQGNFRVNGVAGIITTADFAPVAGTAGAYVYTKKDITSSMPLNVATTFSNTTGKFQLGFFNMAASNGGCMYGFFSDFKSSTVTSSQLETCRLDSVQLNAIGGVSYLWSPAIGLSNPNINNPKASPPSTTNYKVIITDASGCIDSAFVNVVINTCDVASCSFKNDFSLKRDACNPFNVEFSTNAIGYNSIKWDFGDGNTAIGVTTTTNAYANPGNYLVTMITEYPICSDTVKKTVAIDIQQDNQLIATIDTTYCGSTKQILSNAGLNFCWTPTTFLNNPNSPNPITSTPNNITYYLTSLSTGANLVPNGNFTAGNTGFTSQYIYTPNNTTEGEYFVGPNPQAWNALAPSCGDHTTGTGNMMLVNGSPLANAEIWKTTVPVTPNTNYSFSTWICPISIPNPGQLAFSINGNSIGGLVTTTLPTCNWTQFYTTWNSGPATTAIISLINKNLIAFGNDFALDDISLAPVSMKKDSVKITISCLIPPCPQKNDFSFNRDPCTPLDVEFTTSATGYSSIKWDFGDGNTASAVTTTNNIYSAPGNYLVTMITAYATCADTIKKTISVDLQNDPLTVATPDTTICLGTTKKLRAQPGLNFCWTPTTFLDDPLLPEPTTSTPGNMTYYLTAEVTGPSVITNGNFNAGNTGFSSDYNYATPNITEAQYFVGPSPQAWNSSLSNCSDHTTGSGNMMLVNGSPTPNLKVWKQTVTVIPNTNYAFSTWIQALYPPNPAQLQFSINGNDVGTMITASLPTCTWTQFYTTWNSGTNTSTTISIVNKNTQVQGNDFALDDISFAPIYMRRDSVKITVDTPSIVTSANASICEGASVQLNTTGASTYSWSPVTGLSNPGIANPIATPVVTTEYHVTGINAFGCEAKDTVTIDVSPKPVISISNDTSICINTSAQLHVTGGSTYNWTPGATLSSTSSPDPVASPLSYTKYYVTVTNAAGCDNLDSVGVNIVSAAQFSVNYGIETCFNKPVQLNASGGDTYSWSPAGTLDDPNIANPLATPLSSTTYFVTITENKCNVSATLSTTVTALPLPLVTANKTNDIDCSQDQSHLIASGAASYSWTPVATLSNPNSGTTVATPVTTTQYIVVGTNTSGCVNYDTVVVNVDYTIKSGYFMPTGFTPNNDGKNDCYGIKLWGSIWEFEFSIYNRWGEMVFFTTNPSDCWNGRYKGAEQNPGVFIYMIKAKTICEPSLFRKGTFLLIR